MLTFIYSDVLIFYKMNPICLNVYVQYITFVFNYFSFILELLFNYIYYLTIFLLLINYKEEIIWHVNHINTFDYQIIIILIYNWIPPWCKGVLHMCYLQETRVIKETCCGLSVFISSKKIYRL